MLTIDRANIDGKHEEVLHIKIVDSIQEKEAHFHLVVGVKNGRPYAEVTGIGKSPFQDKRKRLTAPWKNSIRTG